MICYQVLIFGSALYRTSFLLAIVFEKWSIFFFFFLSLFTRPNGEHFCKMAIDPAQNGHKFRWRSFGLPSICPSIFIQLPSILESLFNGFKLFSPIVTSTRCRRLAAVRFDVHLTSFGSSSTAASSHPICLHFGTINRHLLQLAHSLRARAHYHDSHRASTWTGKQIGSACCADKAIHFARWRSADSAGSGRSSDHLSGSSSKNETFINFNSRPLNLLYRFDRKPSKLIRPKQSADLF